VGTQLRKIPRLDQLDTPALAQAIDSPNGWQRDTAERLVLENPHSQALPLLVEMLSRARAKTRLQALCTLEAWPGMTPQILLIALSDTYPSIRENAIRISEPLLRHLADGDRYVVQAGDSLGKIAESSGMTVKAFRSATGLETDSVRVGQKLQLPPEVIKVPTTLLKLVDDPEMRVRQQLAFTLGEWDDPRAAQALVQLASDSRLQTAVMSSAPRHVGGMLAAVLPNDNPSSRGLLEQLLGLATAMGEDALVVKTVTEVCRSKDGMYLPWQFAAVAGFLDALDRQKVSSQKSGTPAKIDSSNLKLEGVFSAARMVIADPRAPDAARLGAIRLLGRDRTSQQEDFQRLGELLRPDVPSALQTAALAGLQRSSALPVAGVVLAAWKGYSPSLRTEVLNLLFSRPEWLEALLGAIDSGKISTAGIGTVHQQKLLAHPNASIRLKSEQLFSATRHDRQLVLKEYANVEKLKGDPSKGLALFRQNCSPCHLFKGDGHEIGVDLNTMAGKPTQVLLVAILDPNQAVEARYVNYVALTKDDREISGVITAETATSITLRSPGGNEQVILRNDLKELTSSGLSLMPEGFEKALDPQAMADLIAYVLSR